MGQNRDIDTKLRYFSVNFNPFVHFFHCARVPACVWCHGDASIPLAVKFSCFFPFFFVSRSARQNQTGIGFRFAMRFRTQSIGRRCSTACTCARKKMSPIRDVQGQFSNNDRKKCH